MRPMDEIEQPTEEITLLLGDARKGSALAQERLYAHVYRELHRLAERQLRGDREHGGATSLVHEAFFKLSRAATEFNDRQHFFAVAARAMRQIVMDHVRRQGAAKRGAGFRLTTLGDKAAAADAAADTVLAVHEALEALAATSPRLVEVVEACYFLGLTTEEAGEALGLSARTVKREWQKARMVLGALLAPGATP